MEIYEKEHWIDDQENITVQSVKTGPFCDKHTHDFFEFVYMKKGTAAHYIDGVKYSVKHGDLLFINRNQTHSYEADEGFELVNILINPEFIGKELVNTESLITLFSHSMFEEFENINGLFSQCAHFSGNETAETDTIIDLLLREYNEKKIGYKSIMHGGIRILFSKVLRSMQIPNTPSVSDENYLLTEIKNYIDENFNKKITLSEIAAKSFYNPIYFGNLLKKNFGKSFSTYIKEKRISKAAELLKTTDKPVDEIMSLVGYNDKKLFYRHFKEIYITTPAAFKNL